jgi:protein kinase-like protein
MDALRELHRASVLHRDVSPDNIYITNSGQIKLLDFGAARQALRDRSQRLSVILKVGYAPEEQYRSSGNQGPWTDLYAVGATFYHLLTGQIPPPSIDRLADDQIQYPSALGSDIPPGAEDALMTALAVKATQRYPSIQDFQAAIGLPSSATAPRRSYPPTMRWMRMIPLPPWAEGIARNPWAMRAGAAAGLVLIFFAAFLIFRHRGPAIPTGPYGLPASAYDPASVWKLAKLAHAGEIAPLKDSWPPADLDQITQRALARARKWTPDAEFMELEVNLDQSPAPGYPYDTKTDAGIMQLKFTFFSPSKQQAILITPNSGASASGQPDGDVFPLGYVDWGNKNPIPARFLSLPDAIKRAQQKGMRAPTISKADLTNDPPDGWGGPGLKWLITPVFGDGYAIDAKVAADTPANSG